MVWFPEEVQGLVVNGQPHIDCCSTLWLTSNDYRCSHRALRWRLRLHRGFSNASAVSEFELIVPRPGTITTRVDGVHLEVGALSSPSSIWLCCTLLELKLLKSNQFNCSCIHPSRWQQESRIVTRLMEKFVRWALYVKRDIVVRVVQVSCEGVLVYYCLGN